MSGLAWNFFEIAVNYYQGFVIAFFIYKFLTPKIKSRAKIGLIIFSVAMGTIVTILNHYTVFEGAESVLYLLCIFIYALIFFKDSIVKKVFASIIPLLLLFIISTIDLNLISTLNNMSIEEIVSKPSLPRATVLLSIQAIYYFSISLVLKKFHSDSISFHLSEWSTVISVMFISSIMVGFMHMITIENLSHKQRILINLSLIILLLINIFVFHMINLLLKKNKQIQEMEIMQIQEQYQQQYIDNANVQYESMRKIRHDLKNQLSVVYGLLAEKEYDTAMEFIGKSTKILSNADTVVNTENRIVNAIMNAKLATASAYGIKAECLTVSDFSGIDEIDLCNLLSNTLENALFACINKTSDSDKFIRIKISRENGIYTFLIRNSIESSVLESNPTLRTTKADKINHGLGTKIIEDIANKYNGRCDFYEIEKEFCCQVMLKSK
jgi:sensor histidine kinase YesM